MNDLTNQEATSVDTGAPKSGRLAVFVFVLICSLVAYPAIQLAVGQWMLAASLMLISGISIVIAYRLVRRRGRVSLAIAVVGLPLLAALSIAVVTRVVPLLGRQQSFAILEQAGIGYGSRSPIKVDNWVRDRSGNLIPRWMVNLIGPDCLSELSSIDGQLRDFQSVDYRQIDCSHLSWIKLVRFDSNTEISSDLIDWFNQTPRLSLTLNLYEYSSNDALQLGRLTNSLALTTHLDETTGDLSPLNNARELSLVLTGDRLSQEQSHAVGELSNLSQLHLEVPQLPPETFALLAELPQLRFLDLARTTISVDNLKLIASIKSLRNVLLRGGLKVPALATAQIEVSADAGVDTLYLERFSVDEILNLVRLFHCQEVTIDRTVMTAEQVNSLWEVPSLRKIEVYRPNGFELDVYDRPESHDHSG